MCGSFTRETGLVFNKSRVYVSCTEQVALHGPHTKAPRTASEAYGCDFTSVEQVRVTGARVAKRHSHIDVLVHCAGVMFPNALTTEVGLETTVQVNSIAPFILTEELQAGLVRPPRGMPCRLNKTIRKIE
mmetsp:Transcript_34770/g.137126  ORF Transcript_34770/g.137126 Transcript_34770/m.137126 type:complete len:130 (-) Transcript_34770:1320-1709(-)